MSGFSLGELFVSLGFDVDDDKLKAFNDSIKDTQRTLLHIGEAAAGAVVALYEFLDGPISRASQFKQFTDQTGYSAEALQEWARTVSLVNRTVSFDQALGQYRAFTDYVMKMRAGGGGVALASLLTPGDLNIGLGPDKQLELLSNAARNGEWVNRFGADWRSYVLPKLSQLGLGAGWLDAIMKTPGERHDMTAGMGQTQAQADQLDKLNEKFGELQARWETFMKDFAVAHGDEILKVLQDLTKELPALIEEIKEISDTMGGWKNIIMGVVGAFAILKGMQVALLLSGIGDAMLGMAAGSASKGFFAGLARFGLGLGAGVTGAAAGVGAFGIGMAAPIAADKYLQWDGMGWGGHFAHGLDSLMGNNNIVDRTVARIGDALTGGHAYMPKKDQSDAGPRVEHLLGDTTIIINSNQSPADIADEVDRRQKKRRDDALTRAYDQTNLGAQF